ncbi:MAG: hypothetical protein ACR2GE_00825 [Pseudonocardia sp.]
MSTIFDQIDTALEQVQRAREQLITDVSAAHRESRVARLYEIEAGIWSRLFELSRCRLHWRAALAAEALARQHAQRWRSGSELVPAYGSAAMETQLLGSQAAGIVLDRAVEAALDDRGTLSGRYADTTSRAQGAAR